MEFDTSAPWSWRLGSPSGSSSSLGPAASASLTSSSPLSSLSHPSTSASADGICWQSFRLPTQSQSRKFSKKARLHRFDSDDEDADETIRPNKDLKDQAAGSEDEDAGELGSASSSSEDEADDNDILPASKGESNETSSAPPSQPTTLTRRKRGRPRHSDDIVDSSRIIAHIIDTHASSSTSEALTSLLHSNIQSPPLTWKETVRLVRLIAMIFRFPKPTRRVSRRKHQKRTEAISNATSSSSPQPADDTKDVIELKTKYLPTHSTSRRPRMLAKVHPDDAQPNSPAVLKLLALIPAALPARVECAGWIVGIAVRARRDEHGNIILSDRAYLPPHDGSAHDASGSAGEGIKTEIEGDDMTMEDGGVKVTRSMRQKLGKEAPAIPLPKFWRRRQDGEVVKQEEAGSTSPAEAEVDILTPALTSDTPEPDSAFECSQPQLDTGVGRVKVVNLSKVLAERMREKRQAKTLLLRTHQSLRKPRNAGSETGTEGSVEADDEARTEGDLEEQEEEGEELEAETRANTLANSGGVEQIKQEPVDCV